MCPNGHMAATGEFIIILQRPVVDCRKTISGSHNFFYVILSTLIQSLLIEKNSLNQLMRGLIEFEVLWAIQVQN